MRTYPSLVHANGNLLCSVKVETTGKRPGYNEIIQVAFVPLDSDLRPLPVLPFYQNVRPVFESRADRKVMNANGLSLDTLQTTAPDASSVADLARDWFEQLDLPKSKNLMPVAHDWRHQSEFIKPWLTEELFSVLFHEEYRDSKSLAISINDVCAFHGEKISYNHTSLWQMCQKLGVENLAPHDALSDAVAGAEVYRRLIHAMTELSVV